MSGFFLSTCSIIQETFLIVFNEYSDFPYPIKQNVFLACGYWMLYVSKKKEFFSAYLRLYESEEIIRFPSHHFLEDDFRVVVLQVDFFCRIFGFGVDSIPIGFRVGRMRQCHWRQSGDMPSEILRQHSSNLAFYLLFYRRRNYGIHFFGENDFHFVSLPLLGG